MLVSVCAVCRLERFARYLGRREGKDGGETRKQKALLIGSLSSSLHRDGVRKVASSQLCQRLSVFSSSWPIRIQQMKKH